MRFTGCLLSLLVLLSCETNFEPSGSNFVEIDTTAQPIVTVNLSMQDTLGLLILDDQVSLSYELEIGNLKLYEVHVTLDDAIIFTGHSRTDNFYYDPNDYSEGNHTLRIEFITSSGRGSIADISGAEGYQFYQEYGILNIRNSFPEPLSILNAAPDQGGLVVSWEKYTRLNFESYSLSSSLPLYTTYLPDDTSFLDPHYIGGEVEYTLRVVTPDGSPYSERFSYQSPPPEMIRFEQLDENSVQVYWSKCRFPTNFGKYIIGAANQSAQYLTNIDDTTATLDQIPFGDYTYVNLSTHPKSQQDTHEYIQGGENLVWVGTNTGHRAQSAVYVPENENLYLTSRWVVGRYDGDSLNLEASYELPTYGTIEISPDGSHIVARENYSISRLDSETLQPVFEPDLAALIGWAPHVRAIAVANDNLLFFAAQPATGPGDLEIFALNTEQGILLDRISKTSPENYVEAMECTAEGDYVVHDYEFLHFDGSQFTRHHNYYNAEFVTFNPEGDYFVYAFLGEPAKLINMATMVSDMTLNSTQAFSPSFDPVTGYLGFYSNQGERYKIYNVETQSTIDHFSATLPTNGAFTLFDNRVISSEGFLRDVNE